MHRLRLHREYPTLALMSSPSLSWSLCAPRPLLGTLCLINFPAHRTSHSLLVGLEGNFSTHIASRKALRSRTTYPSLVLTARHHSVPTSHCPQQYFLGPTFPRLHASNTITSLWSHITQLETIGGHVAYNLMGMYQHISDQYNLRYTNS